MYTVIPCCNDFTYLKLHFHFALPSKSKVNFLPRWSTSFIMVLLEIALPWFPHVRPHSDSAFMPVSLSFANLQEFLPPYVLALYIYMWGAYSSQKLLPSKSFVLLTFHLIQKFPSSKLALCRYISWKRLFSKSFRECIPIVHEIFLKKQDTNGWLLS